MTREMGKSILLIFLVTLSLTLTWSIWSYQGEYAPTNPSQPVKNSTIASSYNIYDVVKPYQVLRFNPNAPKEVKGLYGNGADPLYTILRAATLTAFPTLPSQFPRAVGHSYELVFPTPLSTSVIKSIFNFSSSGTSAISQDWLISSVLIYQTQTKTEDAYVVFKDKSGQPLFYAKGSIKGLKSYNKNYGDTENWLNYTKLNLKDHIIYVPNEPIKSVSIESHLYTLTPFDLYKPILFTNPRQVLYMGNGYSNGVSQLQDRQKVVMQYYNAVTGQSGANGSSGSFGDPVLQSYKFINDHKGWTNLFNVDSFTAYPAKGQAEVTFRMSKNGLPVFSMDAYPYGYESEIYMMWDGSDLSKFDRTLINVGVSYKPSKQTTVITPLDNIKLLKKTKAFQLDNVTDFRLGYEMTLNQREQAVTFTPGWFFKQNGAWVSVTDFLNSHSNDLQGIKGGGS